MIEHEQYYRKGGTYELPIEIYNDLIQQIEEAQKERNNYKSRCEKAIKFIKSTYFYGIRSGRTLIQKYLCDLINILNGSDEK